MPPERSPGYCCCTSATPAAADVNRVEGGLKSTRYQNKLSKDGFKTAAMVR